MFPLFQLLEDRFEDLYHNMFEKEDIARSMAIEESKLYTYLSRATEKSLKRCLTIIDKMSDDDVRVRHLTDRSTYLHHLVNIAPEVQEKHGDLLLLIPIVYRLAIRNIGVNAQNEHGNTCLHLACLRPNADSLCPHLIRIGCDPCIMNQKKCRVIHTVKNNRCHLVKNQSAARSGLWNAVDKEDLVMVEKLMKCWCRVNVRKNKSLRNVGEETGNTKILHMLSKYEKTNDLVCAAMACQVDKMKEILRTGDADVNTCDHSHDVPKPLLVAVGELGEVGMPATDLLKKHGAAINNYFDHVSSMEEAFEGSPFYKLISEGTETALNEALDLLTSNKVSIHLTSQQEDTMGQTYMHFIVQQYYKLKSIDEELTRLLIRMLYRLALSGINIHIRDAKGNTALVMAAMELDLDQSLLNHLIRLGCDPSLTTKDGRAVNEEVYEDKGKLVFDKNYRQSDLPGLWVAVKNNDATRTERWLKSWARVNIYHGDRKLVEVAKAMGHKAVVKLLETYAHINEFVCTTFACDLKAMMQLLSLGKGQHKVNTIDDFFHVGFTWDRHAEFMSRPIIVNAMEICTTEIVDFLLNFGADLSKVYEESAPCGPVALWAFRDHVDNKNALVVAQHADVELRDEYGCTMLHKVAQKQRMQGQTALVEVLLDRGINLAARDIDGSTTLDYLTMSDAEQHDDIRLLIEDFIITQVNNDQHYWLESLIVDGYDQDIRAVCGRKRRKTAKEIAELKELKEIVALFHDLDVYKKEIELLHQAAMTGDVLVMSRLAGERRYAWSRHKSGRTLLHQGVLYEQPEVVRFICEQYPGLINSRDNLMRTPLHYCVTLSLSARRLVWPTLQDAGADPNLIDANNMSVYDYLREMETATLKRDKPRGRRERDYRPEYLIAEERSKVYGAKVHLYTVNKDLQKMIPGGASVKEVRGVTSRLLNGLGHGQYDADLMKLCMDHKRVEVAKHLLHCGVRKEVTIKCDENDTQQTLVEYAEEKKLVNLSEYIKKWIENDDVTAEPEVVEEEETVIENGDVTEGELDQQEEVAEEDADLEDTQLSDDIALEPELNGDDDEVTPEVETVEQEAEVDDTTS